LGTVSDRHERRLPSLEVHETSCPEAGPGGCRVTLHRCGGHPIELTHRIAIPQTPRRSAEPRPPAKACELPICASNVAPQPIFGLVVEKPDGLIDA
jgi:hypothetical protein